MDEDNAEHEKFAVQLRDQLLQMMEDRAVELSSDDMFLTKLKLQETVQQFKVVTLTLYKLAAVQGSHIDLI